MSRAARPGRGLIVVVGVGQSLGPVVGAVIGPVAGAEGEPLPAGVGTDGDEPPVGVVPEQPAKASVQTAMATNPPTMTRV